MAIDSRRNGFIGEDTIFKAPDLFVRAQFAIFPEVYEVDVEGDRGLSIDKISPALVGVVETRSR